MAPMKRPAPYHRGRFSGTLSPDAVARRLHITRKEVRQLLASGSLNFVQICGRLRVPRVELQRFADQAGTPR